ncbi:MAG: LysM peptidoglycan-binding domain-containing protein [Angelakisella sp.]
MRRKIIFKDSQGTELMLPVTPPEFKVAHGRKIEMVGMFGIGDVNFYGGRTLCNFELPILLPTGARSYTNENIKPPEYYIAAFEKWIDKKELLRFVVSGTSINIPVLLGSIEYGEKDGTNDVYGLIKLAEHPTLALVTYDSGTGNKQRFDARSDSPTQSYVIKRGDTLSAICRKFYGEAALYPRLAAFNGIKNPNLICTGATLKLPERSLLR